MQEYGTPAVVEIAPSANLADVVFERADREPQAVIMRRQAEGAARRGARSPPRSSAARSRRWPRGSSRPGSGQATGWR